VSNPHAGSGGAGMRRNWRYEKYLAHGDRASRPGLLHAWRDAIYPIWSQRYSTPETPGIHRQHTRRVVCFLLVARGRLTIAPAGPTTTGFTPEPRGLLLCALPLRDREGSVKRGSPAALLKSSEDVTVTGS
jgi:hypothetical protein